MGHTAGRVSREKGVRQFAGAYTAEWRRVRGISLGMDGSTAPSSHRVRSDRTPAPCRLLSRPNPAASPSGGQTAADHPGDLTVTEGCVRARQVPPIG
jgi:hypothetical protein